MTSTRRFAYLDAVDPAVGLLREPAVAAAWEADSALAEFTVGGLAGHLANQVLNVPAILDDQSTAPQASLLDHYLRAEWIGADLDDPINVRVRELGDELAAGGPAALADRAAETTAGLRGRLAAEPAERMVCPPGKDYSLSLDDYLVTRMLEIVVHSDDLAVSVGVDTPQFHDRVVEPVFALLTRLAARRHGQAELVRALTRAERAPASITAM